jgi:hypothetical protein
MAVEIETRKFTVADDLRLAEAGPLGGTSNSAPADSWRRPAQPLPKRIVP